MIALPLQKILDAPAITVEEVVEIKQILPHDIVYANVRRNDVAKYSKELRDRGFNIGLHFDLFRPELNGAYVLEVI